jgi:hypothetical protein
MSETKTKNLCTVPAADLTDNQYFIAEDGGELKRIPKAQVVLKKLEKMLATDTENLAGGGEVTAQKLLDVLAEQVANKLLAKSQVVNNLLATVEGNPLDATQGKALKDLIDTTNNNLSNKVDKTSLSSYALKSDLDSSKLKSMTFTAMSDEYAQIAIGNPGILICAVSNNYLLARQDNGVCRVIGDIRNNELSFKRNVKVSGIAFYV